MPAARTTQRVTSQYYQVITNRNRWTDTIVAYELRADIGARCANYSRNSVRLSCDLMRTQAPRYATNGANVVGVFERRRKCRTRRELIALLVAADSALISIELDCDCIIVQRTGTEYNSIEVAL
jgi:hypothetical protein